MLEQYLTLAMYVMAIIVLVFAYLRNNNLARLSVYTMFAAILLSVVLNQIASLFVDIQALDVLRNLFNQIAGLVDIAEIVLLLVLLLSPKPRAGSNTLKTALIVYIVIKALLVFGIL